MRTAWSENRLDTPHMAAPQGHACFLLAVPAGECPTGEEEVSLGFRVEDSGVRVEGLELRVQGLGHLRCRDWHRLVTKFAPPVAASR